MRPFDTSCCFENCSIFIYFNLRYKCQLFPLAEMERQEENWTCQVAYCDQQRKARVALKTPLLFLSLILIWYNHFSLQYVACRSATSLSLPLLPFSLLFFLAIFFPTLFTFPATASIFIRPKQELCLPV